MEMSAAQALPLALPSTSNCIEAPPIAVPVKVNAEPLVILSVFELPESELDARSGVVGAVST